MNAQPAVVRFRTLKNLHSLCKVSSALGLALLTACSGGSGSSDTTVAEDRALPEVQSPALPPAVDGDMVTVSGILTASDGATPIGSASVFQPGLVMTASSGSPGPATVDTASCLAPAEAHHALVCSAADGSFELRLAPGRVYNYKATKGAFAAQFTVDVPADASASETIVIAPVRLGDDLSNNGRMAVVTGAFDAMQNVLAKSGFGEVGTDGELVLGTERFDLFDGDYSLSSGDGSYPAFSALFQSGPNGKPRLHDYDIIFLNCGLDDYTSDVSPTNPATIEALRGYVLAGGRLYVTDLAYDYVEQAFPEYIDFFGSDEVPASEAEYTDAAEYGVGEIVIENAAILDDSLLGFLRSTTCDGLPCLNADGRSIRIDGLSAGWTLMNGRHANNPAVTFMVEGPAEDYSGETPVRPLTAVVNVGAGKLIFSSYHSEATAIEGLLPQERVLQYLVFE